MDRRSPFPKSRIAKIMDLATSQMANKSFKNPIEVEIEQTGKNNNTNEGCYRYHVREPIEESLTIKSPVPTINEHQNPIFSENPTDMVIDNKNTNKTDVNSSKNLLNDLRLLDSSSDGDFGSSSSDNYICASDESSSSTDDERTPVKKRRTATLARNNITIPETPSPINGSIPDNASPGCSFWKKNGMNSDGKKKKARKSEKERRQDRVKRKLFRNTGLEYITVSKTILKKVFDTMNLSFKKPSIDTCSKCDRINMKLKYASEAQAANLTKTLEEHQEAFKAAYEEKKKDKELAQSCEDVMVITFDLQQCLPTPHVQTNVAFYKRQLWTYNLTINDLKTNKAFCYTMWPECEGNRGANDIASCLYDFIINQLPYLNSNAKKLIMYSDSCPGQNKNSIVTTMLMLVAKLSPQLLTIEHKFLVPGHTHMEADTDHALIERKKKHTSMDIHLPRDWYQLVRTASKKTAKFTVIEMTHNMFYDFNIFSKQFLTIRKTNTANEKFLWCDVRSVLYTKENMPRFYYKKEFKNVEYMIIDYSKRGKAYDMITINTVPKAYHTKINISTEKKKDLLDLLCFIHESAHEFYRSLSCKSDVKDTPPDNDDDSDDE